MKIWGCELQKQLSQTARKKIDFHVFLKEFNLYQTEFLKGEGKGEVGLEGSIEGGWCSHTNF